MKLLVLLLSSLAMAVAGCAMQPSVEQPLSTSDTMKILGRHQWQLQQATDRHGQRIQALFARPDKPLTLGFQEGRVHVSHACNVLNGNVTLADGKLAVKRMISTMMACGNPAVSGLDKAISSRLQQPAAYRLDTATSPPTLILTTPTGDTLVFAGKTKHDADTSN